MIKLLAVESSGLVASVAVVTEEKILGEFSVNLKLTHSQTLLPMVDTIVKMTGTELSEIDAIAVAKGPGSFTGLRIGAATVKGLGQALNKPIVAVPTAEGLAKNIFGFDGVIIPIMDARRNQVYTGVYKNTSEGFKVVKDQMAVDVNEIIDLAGEIGEKAIFLGDGVPVFKDIIEKNIKVPVQFAPVNMLYQSAASLGVRAIELFKEGKTELAAEHMPDYLRLSQAERERNENQTHGN